MINYFGTTGACLNVGFPDPSGVCDQARIDQIYDRYLEEFLTILFDASYPNSSIKMSYFGASPAFLPGVPYPKDGIARPLNPNIDADYLSSIPFLSGLYPISWNEYKLFRLRKPSGSVHLPSRRLYDNVFKYFCDLQVSGTTAVPEVDADSGNDIKDSNGETLIRPFRYNPASPYTRVFQTGVQYMNAVAGANEFFEYPSTGAPSTGVMNISSPGVIKSVPPLQIQIPMSVFVPEAAVVFTLYCIREQMLIEDPDTTNRYNYFQNALNFFLSEGFMDTETLRTQILDPDLFVNDLISLMLSSIPNAALFSPAIASTASVEKIAFDILERYREFKTRKINEFANCMYRKFGWRGDPFDARLLMKGEGGGTKGILNIQNAGVGLANYSYKFDGITLDNALITETEFDFKYDGTRKLHWNAWGFDSAMDPSELRFEKDNELYSMRAKDDESGFNGPFAFATREIFYPRLLNETKPNGAYLSRMLTIPINFNSTFVWREPWWKMPKTVGVIATYTPANQTMDIRTNGTLKVGFTDQSTSSDHDEVFLLMIAFTTDTKPYNLPGLTPKLSLSFELDLDKTFRDDHFTLIPPVRSTVFTDAKSLANLDAMINEMVTRYDPQNSLPPYELKSLVIGNGIGLRPRAYVDQEQYKKNETVIVQSAVGEYNVYRCVKDHEGLTAFDPLSEDWVIEISAYNSSKPDGYRKRNQVIYNPNYTDPNLADPIYAGLYEAIDDVEGAPGVFDETKWRRIPIVTTDIERKHFPPLDTSDRSGPLKIHHEQLRYAFLNVEIQNNEIKFIANAWTSPIRSRMDRMYRNYNKLDPVSPPTAPLLNLVDDINELTFYDPSQDADAGTPGALDPVFPDRNYFLRDNNVPGGVRTNDGRTYAPGVNADYPHDDDNVGAPHPGYDPSPGWIPIYNPLLSCFRAMHILEVCADRIIERAIENGVTGNNLTKLTDAVNVMKDSASFETMVWNNGVRSMMAVSYGEFDRLRIDASCPEQLPSDLTCADFTNGMFPNWTHGFGFVDPNDPCTPC